MLFKKKNKQKSVYVLCAQASKIRNLIPDTLRPAHRCSAFGIHR